MLFRPIRYFVILAAVVLAGCTGQPAPAALPASPGIATAHMTATRASVGCMRLHFVLLATTDPLAQSAISSEQAVSAAWQYEPGLKAFTIEDLALGRLGNPADGGMTVSALAGDPLVWLVSFAGVKSVSSGPPGVEHHTSNGYAVVIDANTSQPLVAFPLCD